MRNTWILRMSASMYTAGRIYVGDASVMTRPDIGIAAAVLNSALAESAQLCFRYES